MPDGRSVPMTDKFREEIIAKYSSMAVRPLRCLALATKVSSEVGREVSERGAGAAAAGGRGVGSYLSAFSLR